MNLNSLLSELNSLANPQRAQDLNRFFKTDPGHYGYGDQFIGLRVPQIRSLVKIYWNVLDLPDIQNLLINPIHEYRLLALLILVKKYPLSPKIIYDFYLKNTKYINNWDLVDASSRYIVGRYCYEHQNYSILHELSLSSDLWEKRIAITATAFLINQNIFNPTLEISRTLLSDPHDLIHKAVGWMLREVGKKDQQILLSFLNEYALKMSRTTLRYAIEKFPEDLRQHYLSLKA